MQQNYRPWSRVFTLAVAITLLIVIATAIINPLFDRVVNWGMLAVVSLLIFGVLVVAFRRRWF